MAKYDVTKKQTLGLNIRSKKDQYTLKKVENSCKVTAMALLFTASMTAMALLFTASMTATSIELRMPIA